jgi:ribosome-associated protein
MTDTPATAVRRNVTKLQKAIVDGLEDVKAQDIQVFDTEHLTSLFERVIVASGTSNRQTKALAASVRDAVRAAGFDKPRIEGEDNGEWIIVDCGVAVVHIMQPTIRQYYHLEELWGEKPVKSRAARALKAVAVPAKKAAPSEAQAARPAPSAPRERTVKPVEPAGTQKAAGKRTATRSAGKVDGTPAVKAAPAPKKRTTTRTAASKPARKTGTGKA